MVGMEKQRSNDVESAVVSTRKKGEGRLRSGWGTRATPSTARPNRSALTATRLSQKALEAWLTDSFMELMEFMEWRSRLLSEPRTAALLCGLCVDNLVARRYLWGPRSASQLAGSAKASITNKKARSDCQLQTALTETTCRVQYPSRFCQR